MPYDTPYNRMIAREVDYINQRYVTHSDMTGQGTVDYRMSGQGMSGGFLGAFTGPLLSAVAGPLINKILGGGPGVAEFKTANASKKDDMYEESSADESSESECECEEGNKKCNKPRKGGANPRAVGGAILGFQEGTILGRPKRKVKAQPKLESSFSSLTATSGITNRPVADVVIGNANKQLSSAQAMTMLQKDRPFRGMGKRGRPRKTGAGVFDNIDVPEKMLMKLDPNNPPEYLIKKYMPVYRDKRVRSQQELEQYHKDAVKKASEAIKNAQSKVGSGIISDLHIPVISNIAGLFGLGKKKRGRPSKKVGGSAEMSHNKITVKSTRGKPEKVVEKSQMVGSTMSGFGKPKNKRAEVVKKVMKERGVSMIEASKIVKNEGLY